MTPETRVQNALDDDVEGNIWLAINCGTHVDAPWHYSATMADGSKRGLSLLPY